MRIITIARKPLAGSVAQTVLKYGTGGLNIDACRVGLNPEADASQIRVMNRNQKSEENGWGMNQKTNSGLVEVVSQKGRWPANLILQHLPECQEENCAEGCPVGSLNALGVTSSRATKREILSYKGGGGTGFLRGDTNPRNQHDDSGSVARFFKQVKG